MLPREFIKELIQGKKYDDIGLLHRLPVVHLGLYAYINFNITLNLCEVSTLHCRIKSLGDGVGPGPVPPTWAESKQKCGGVKTN